MTNPQEREGRERTVPFAERLCAHCGGREALRMPVPESGCDHLYYPDNCKTCKAAAPKSGYDTLLAQRDRLVEALEKIAAIKNKPMGADWEEIDEARDIATAALSTVKKAEEGA